MWNILFLDCGFGNSRERIRRFLGFSFYSAETAFARKNPPVDFHFQIEL